MTDKYDSLVEASRKVADDQVELLRMIEIYRLVHEIQVNLIEVLKAQHAEAQTALEARDLTVKDLSDDLATAQARIAELEARLKALEPDAVLGRCMRVYAEGYGFDPSSDASLRLIIRDDLVRVQCEGEDELRRAYYHNSSWREHWNDGVLTNVIRWYPNVDIDTCRAALAALKEADNA